MVEYVGVYNSQGQKWNNKTQSYGNVGGRRTSVVRGKGGKGWKIRVEEDGKTTQLRVGNEFGDTASEVSTNLGLEGGLGDEIRAETSYITTPKAEEPKPSIWGKLFGGAAATATGGLIGNQFKKQETAKAAEAYKKANVWLREKWFEWPKVKAGLEAKQEQAISEGKKGKAAAYGYIKGAAGIVAEDYLGLLSTVALVGGLRVATGGLKIASMSTKGYTAASAMQKAITVGAAAATGVYATDKAWKVYEARGDAGKVGEIAGRTTVELVTVAGAWKGASVIMSPLEERAMIRAAANRLPPAKQAEFWAKWELTKELGDMRPIVKDVNFQTENIRKPQEARLIENWIRKNNIIVGGSASQEAQMRYFKPKPHDIDGYYKGSKRKITKELKKLGDDLARATGDHYTTHYEGKYMWLVNENNPSSSKKMMELHDWGWLKSNIGTVNKLYRPSSWSLVETPKGIKIQALDIQAKRKLVAGYLERGDPKDFKHFNAIIKDMLKRTTREAQRATVSNPRRAAIMRREVAKSRRILRTAKQRRIRENTRLGSKVLQEEKDMITRATGRTEFGFQEIKAGRKIAARTAKYRTPNFYYDIATLGTGAYETSRYKEPSYYNKPYKDYPTGYVQPPTTKPSYPTYPTTTPTYPNYPSSYPTTYPPKQPTSYPSKYPTGTPYVPPTQDTTTRRPPYVPYLDWKGELKGKLHPDTWYKRKLPFQDPFYRWMKRPKYTVKSNWKFMKQMRGLYG